MITLDTFIQHNENSKENILQIIFISTVTSASNSFFCEIIRKCDHFSMFIYYKLPSHDHNTSPPKFLGHKFIEL